MRRMDSRNGVLTPNLDANGQKSKANGQVMDSEWTANGRRIDIFVQPSGAQFCSFWALSHLILDIVWLLMPDTQTFTNISHLSESDRCELLVKVWVSGIRSQTMSRIR